MQGRGCIQPLSGGGGKVGRIKEREGVKGMGRDGAAGGLWLGTCE